MVRTSRGERVPAEEAVIRPVWADRVEEVLATQQRTKQWLAWVLGMDASQLSHIMRGDPRYLVSDRLKERISRVLGVPYAWVFAPDGTSDVQAASVVYLPDKEG